MVSRARACRRRCVVVVAGQLLRSITPLFTSSCCCSASCRSRSGFCDLAARHDECVERSLAAWRLLLAAFFIVFRPVYNGDMGVYRWRLRFAPNADQIVAAAQLDR